MQTILRTTAKRFLSNNAYKYLAKLYRQINLVIKHGLKSRLKLCGIYHLTDKFDENHTFSGLSYLDIYEKYFQKLKNKRISIFEIGVRDGASLKTWKSYFKRGSVYGIDIDPRCKSSEERRIKIEIGSQDDEIFLRDCFGSDKKFDIIIDDGSHINRMTLASFDYLFNHRLNSKGIYIIEDLGCSYEKLQTDYNVLEIWPGMKYNDHQRSFDNNREDIDRFLLKKIKDLDHRNGNVLSIHFWTMICIIIKI